MKDKSSTKEKHVWQCGRCDPEFSGRGPCPRGGCLAVIVGVKKIVSTTTYFDNKLDLININNNAGSVYFETANLDFLNITKDE